MKPHELNRMAIWERIAVEGLDIKVFSDNYPYMKNGIIIKSSPLNPVYRYAKNYFVDEKMYSLCVITTESNTKKMERWLDRQSIRITGKDITGKFTMTEFRYG